MPIGNPKPGTIASKKYQDKVGLVPKTYKLKRSVVDEFKAACDRDGRSQASVLSELMLGYARKK